MKNFLTPQLDCIESPADLKHLNIPELEQLAKELRHEMIEIVSQSGGHLGASLGVVELTLALHYVFQAPEDILIFDIGHQTYPHKLLTGRRREMHLLRQLGGASGYMSRQESAYDPYAASHAGTSVSAGLGFAVARDLKNEKRHVVSVLGDSALTAGAAYEAINNAGAQANKLIVILNDNHNSPTNNIGAMSAHLSRLLAKGVYKSLPELRKNMLLRFSGSFTQAKQQIPTIFEDLGFSYMGPIDGHNLNHLLPILKNAREHAESGPLLLHVVTEKGRGYAPAEAAVDKFHGVNRFDRLTGIQERPTTATYSQIFSDTLTDAAKHDERIVAITAAMARGTCLDTFRQAFPQRYFDVGVAEQHAVSFAAGLACDGMRPFVGIYSTFLQRAFDQIIHDVSLQRLPVRFAIDRAGFVGGDGPTHAGLYDITTLSAIPHMVIMAPADEVELKHMTMTAVGYDEGPCAFRYPRGPGLGLTLPSEGKPIPIGKGRILQEGSTIALLSLGTRLHECLQAAEFLQNHGLSTTVADARFAKPLDIELLTQLARHHEVLMTIEEGAIGGFGAHVLTILTHENLFRQGLKVRTLTTPDYPLPHDLAERQYERAGLTATGIARAVFEVLGQQVPIQCVA